MKLEDSSLIVWKNILVEIWNIFIESKGWFFGKLGEYEIEEIEEILNFMIYDFEILQFEKFKIILALFYLIIQEIMGKHQNTLKFFKDFTDFCLFNKEQSNFGKELEFSQKFFNINKKLKKKSFLMVYFIFDF